MLDGIGLFDEDFFAYCEDCDLGLRAVWAGWKTAVAPKAVVFHKYSGSSGHYSPFKLRLVERNHYFVALKNFPPTVLLLLPLWSFYRYGLMFIASLCGVGKGAAVQGQAASLLAAFVKGHWEALLGGMRQFRKKMNPKKISQKQFCQLLNQHRLPLHKMIFDP